MDIPSWVIYMIILIIAAIIIITLAIMGWLPDTFSSVKELLYLNPIS